MAVPRDQRRENCKTLSWRYLEYRELTWVVSKTFHVALSLLTLFLDLERFDLTANSLTNRWWRARATFRTTWIGLLSVHAWKRNRYLEWLPRQEPVLKVLLNSTYTESNSISNGCKVVNKWCCTSFFGSCFRDIMDTFGQLRPRA